MYFLTLKISQKPKKVMAEIPQKRELFFSYFFLTTVTVPLAIFLPPVSP